MDNEIILKQFEEIEQRVERLIEICNALEATNLEQKNKIKSLEEEIQGKVEAQRSYAEEKALIRSKIDGLLVTHDGINVALYQCPGPWILAQFDRSFFDQLIENMRRHACRAINALAAALNPALSSILTA